MDPQYEVHPPPPLRHGAGEKAGPPTDSLVEEEPDASDGEGTKLGPPRPRVLLVDDVPDVLLTWKRALHKIYGWDIQTAEGTRDATPEGVLDGALVDHGLADGRGTDVLRSLRAAHPKAVLALITGGYPEREVLDQVASVGALFVLKPLDHGKLMGWAEAVHRAFKARLSPVDLLPEACLLSPRERESIALILDRYSAPEIARILRISVTSVRTYLKLGYSKLEVKNLRELRDKIDAAR